MFELLSVTTVTEATSLWKAVSRHGPPRRASSIPSHPRLIHLSAGPWEQQKRRRVTSGPQLMPLICRTCAGLSGVCTCERTTLSQSAPTRRVRVIRYFYVFASACNTLFVFLGFAFNTLLAMYALCCISTLFLILPRYVKNAHACKLFNCYLLHNNPIITTP